MISELSGILITAISSVTGTGGIAAIFLWKHNKKMRELERQLKDSEVNKARIEGKSDEWHIWKEQNEALSALNKDLTERNKELVAMNAEKEDRHQQDIKDWESRFTEQTTYLRGVQRDLIAANEREKEHIRKEAKLEKERDHYKMWKCYRENDSLDPVEGCGRRKPQQPVLVKYVPLEGECEKCNECIKDNGAD